MKLLFKAALANTRHFGLALITLFSLLCMTVVNQCEIFSIGLMANTGADFFSLFENEKRDGISLSDVEKRWDEIATNEERTITKSRASTFLSLKSQNKNPLQGAMHKVRAKFDLERDFSILIVLLVCVAIFKALSLFFSRYVTQLLSIRITRDLREQYFEHIQSLPLSFYQDQNLGSLSSRAVGDAGQIASSLNSCLTNYIQTPFTLASSLLACFYLSLELSMIIFFGLPLIILPVVLITRRVKKISRQLQKKQETFSSVLLDFLSGIQTVKIFAMEPFSLNKYREQNNQMAKLESRSAKYGLLMRPLLHMVATSCLVIVVLFGLYTLHMTIGQLLMFSGCLHLFYEPVKKFAEENANIQRGVVAAERMFEVLDLQSHISDKPGAIPLKSFKNLIEFDHVWFKYHDKWVLKDIRFSLKQGEVLAIVGPTGSGKSTLVNLLPRLYEAQKGEIRVDGIPIHALTQKSLRDQVAFVSQKPFLFYDTVLKNIAFGRGFSREEVIEAAKQAYAHEFIIDLPQQYDTLLSETGKSLSGGQQQRLAIARALVKKAPILIMDEATSSLDAISEQRIKQAILDLQGKVTQILIAHRLSTIEHADRILYIEKGQIIAEGTLSSLLETSPQFRTLWETYHSTNRSIV